MRAALAITLVAVALAHGAPPTSATRRDVPAIYSTNVDDAWNRIFAALFTRRFETHVTDEHPGNGPFVERAPLGMSGPARISTRTVERFEEGDRAIEALYPSFLTRRGVDAVLTEPGNSALVRALDAALAETQARPAIDRALMQSDLWSAFDSLSSLVRWRGIDAPSRLFASQLLGRLARLMAKIALTHAEIDRLPDNYAARRSGVLPDLFASDGPWMEVEWGKDRMHDGSEGSTYRQAARVFVRPLPTLYGRIFLTALAEQRPATSAVALVRQMMLIDQNMRVVPSPLVVEAQVRTFDRRAAAQVSTTFEQFELSRRVIRNQPGGSGFVRLDGSAPAYLPVAGNDYGFATPETTGPTSGVSVLGTLRTRCNGCHGPDGSHLMSFSLAGGEMLPPPRAFPQPNEIRVRYVAEKKEQRPEFAELVALARGTRR